MYCVSANFVDSVAFSVLQLYSCGDNNKRKTLD